MEPCEKVLVTLQADGPFEIYELVHAFEGLAIEFRETLERHGIPRSEAADVRLLVTKIESGSIVAEIVPGLYFLGSVLPMVEHINIIGDFVRHVSDLLSFFASRPEASPPETTNDRELAAIEAMIKPIASRPHGRFEMQYLRRSNGEETRLDMAFGSEELARAEVRIADARRQLQEPQAQSKSGYEGVLMYWHQASRDPAKVEPKRRTGDRAVIESIWPKPLPVYFMPGAAELKDAMLRREENPFNLAFIVDVDVGTKRGRPVMYIVRKVHDVIRIDDDEERATGGRDGNSSDPALPLE